MNGKEERRTATLAGSRLLSPYDLAEQAREGEDPHAVLYVSIPHGKGERVVTVWLSFDDCLSLADQAIKAAQLLAPYRTTVDGRG